MKPIQPEPGAAATPLPSPAGASPPAASRGQRRRRGALLAAKIAITLAIVVAVFAQVDIRAAFGRFAGFSALAAGLCLALGLGQIVLLAVRWVMVARLTRVRLPVWEAVRCMLAAQFFSQGLPASVGGDALRIWWLARIGIGLGAAARCVLLDRIAGLISLFALNIAAAVLLAALIGRADTGVEIALAVAVGLAVSAALASRTGRSLGLRVVVLLPSRFIRLRGVRRLILWGLRLQRAAGRLVYSRAGVVALAWGVAIHIVTVLLAWIVAQDVGIDVALASIFAVTLPVLLLSYLPLSIGGWGVREGGMAFAFVLLGQPAEAGVFLGLALGALGLGSALLGALVWLVSPMPVTLLGAQRR